MSYKEAGSRKHTPGPWLAKYGMLGDGDRSVYARAFDGSQKYICERVRGGSPEEAEANARLIAAAPTMADDLAIISRVCRRLLTPSQCTRLTVEEEAAFGRAEAVAKAEGRPNGSD